MSRRAIQDDSTSDTELTLEELEEVRGGLDILPSEPPKDSASYQQWKEGHKELIDGTLNIGTGVVTINRAVRSDSMMDVFVQGVAGAHQLGTGLGRVINGYHEMGEAQAKHLQEQRDQVAAAQLKELEELEEQKEAQEEQEREDNRLLDEAEKMLQESSAPADQGSGGAPPANAETYSGELPSFPAQIINAPPPHQPQGTYEPVDAGAGYNNAMPGRIY